MVSNGFDKVVAKKRVFKKKTGGKQKPMKFILRRMVSLHFFEVME